MRQSLQHALSRTGAKSRSINKVICFGLGTLLRPKEEGGREIWHRHMAAFCIAESLKMGDIYFQDPAYDDLDKEYIENVARQIAEKARFPQSIRVHFPEDPEAFHKIDKHTFIVHFGGGIPLRQIVADIAQEPQYQPGGMFWEEVPILYEGPGFVETQSENQLKKYKDGPSLYVKEMVGDYLRRQHNHELLSQDKLTIYARKA